MRKRRGRGEGSIFRRKDGLWVATVTVGRAGTGRRIRRTVYGSTKTEVLDGLVKLQGAASSGLVVEPGRLTVAQFLERWLRDDVEPRRAPETAQRYRSAAQIKIVPLIGGVPLAKLTPLEITSMLRLLESSGESANSQWNAFVVLRTALRWAVRMNLLARSPHVGVETPKVVRPPVRYLQPEEVATFLAAVRGDRLEAFYVLALATGMRSGELLGLDWQHVDFGAAQVHIRQSLHELGGKTWIGAPKTEASLRTVDLPAVAVGALKQHCARMLAEGHPHGLVFVNTAGRPIHRTHLADRSFRPLLKKAGLPVVTIHSLRHSAAVLCILQGVQPKVTQDRLGHKRIATTLDVYAHVTPSMKRAAAASLDAVLSPAAAVTAGD